MKKSSMVLKFNPYEALMINRGNRILIVFNQKHASGSIYTAAARKEFVHDTYSGCCEPFSSCHILTQNINSGFFVNFISLLYTY